MTAWLSLQAVVAVIALGTAALDRLRTAPRPQALLLRTWLLLGLAWISVRALWPSAWTPPPTMSPADLPALVAVRTAADAVPAEVITSVGGLGLLLVALGVLRASWGVVSLALSVGRPVRRIGRVEVRVGPVPMSFAAWWPGRAVVVLDPATWADRTARWVTVRHELQHHRHGDAVWAWVWLAVAALCAPNPAAAWLLRRVRLLDELACDAAVVRTLDPATYAGVLLRAASRARALPVAIPAAALPPLSERISAMTAPRTRAAHLVPAALLGLALIAAAPLAFGGPAGRTVERAARAASDGALTVPADPLVRDVLDRITGSSEGRTFFARGLDRSTAWTAVIEPALAEAGLPAQLAAIPLVESGYANFSADDGVESLAPGPKGAGLWMFIPSTARSYGLVVEPGHDERLDPERETDAAVRLLGDLHGQFGDWGLALAAYNQGAKHVQAAIDAEGTRDALELAERGALNDYVPTVYAAMLIRAEPALVSR